MRAELRVADGRLQVIAWVGVQSRGQIASTPPQRIALGCPLSPIIGAFFLGGLDAQLQRLGLFFVRFMDDVLVLAPTRWKLRRAVKVVNEVLGGLRLEKHRDKTFIGRIEKGFDFLGYHFRLGSLALAEKTVEHFIARAIRLYEQEPGEVLASARLGEYVRRWVRWAGAGLHDRPTRNGGLAVEFSD